MKFVRLYNIFDAHSFLLLQLCGINVDSNLLVPIYVDLIIWVQIYVDSNLLVQI